jgi:serine/threonine protein kinase
MTDSLPGLTIGSYRIVRQIASGGMATVYLAQDLASGQPVAFKLIRPDLLSPEIASMLRARFLREVQVLQRLEHPNIVRIYAAGEYTNQSYLVMEYLPGGTLRDRIRPGLDYRQAAAYLLPVAEALVYAHAQGILHRDIKPANILFDSAGHPHLTDFGIAKDLSAQEMTALTGTGIGIGTPDYMSPEQSLGQPVDARADVYSLGVVLYELVSGKKPFSGTTPAAVLIQHINQPFADPRTYTPNLPEAVVRVLERAMAKQPAARYPDMATFASVLQRLADGDLHWALALTGLPGGLSSEATITPVTALSVPPIPQPQPAAIHPPQPERVTPVRRPAPPAPLSGPPRWLWPVIGFAGLLSLAFLVFVIWSFLIQPGQQQANQDGTLTLEALVTQVSVQHTDSLATPGPGQGTALPPCNQAAFITDVTLPDDLQVLAGEVLIKTWRLRNTGSCTWDASYSLVLVSDTGFGAPAVQPLPRVVLPGENVEISVELSMPTTPGRYQADYRLRSGQGEEFGTGADATGTFFVRLNVLAGTPPTPGSSPTATLAPGATPSATLAPTQAPSPTPAPTHTPVPPSPTPGLVFSTPAAPVAEPPILSGTLAYVEGDSGNWRITLGDPQAWKLASLPGLPPNSGVPAWSPDGRSLLFRSSASGTWQVYRINLDGSGLLQLTSQGENYEATWSPDGQRIAFVSERDGNKEIYLMNADGSSQVRLTNYPDWDDDPSWSPDGQWIVFESQREDRLDVYRMRADGSEQTRLTSGGDMNTTPAWSPDGQWIAFEQERGDETHIWIMDVNGGNQRQVTTAGTVNYRPAWSPDGQWLAVTSNQSGQYAIWIVSVGQAGLVYPFSPGYGVDAAWTRP